MDIHITNHKILWISFLMDIKKTRWHSICLAILSLSVTACTTGSNVSITLENTLDLERPDEPIVLRRADLLEWLAIDIDPANEVIMVNDRSGKVLPSQLDDLDDDGTWDELSFQYSFPPRAKVELTLQWVEQSKDVRHDSRAHAYLGYRPARQGDFKSVDHNVRPDDHEPQSQPYLYQFEGPGWESDKIAYRVYFDSRNGKDIFGKTKTGIFLDSIGLKGNYHKLQPWGMDVLKVGNSLGAGSLAMLKNDSLYRLGKTRSAIFKKIADGPVRAIIQLSYKGWQVESKSYDMDEFVTIWGGKTWYHDKVVIKGSASDTLVTGIVNMFGIVPVQKDVGALEVLASHGRQSENQDMLGMALLTNKDQLARYGSAPKEGDGITFTDYMALKSDSDEFQFYFYTGWELEDKKFADQDLFMKALEDEAVKLSEPIKITFNK
ncbi:DUF4861 domain-containing protein [Fulvivirga sp. M361]|uniref:DUF4861 domain-containing protein n=1 Tax=Fulvivirga sp. M361 TaxID=2594266 RepID=UPI00117A9421|nr:DUF4861 domain-containing protein [Fulvivirga sp. M361]TRX62048.1 DUF4861 domain-containing protein [Fulvivirga sp. M361]